MHENSLDIVSTSVMISTISILVYCPVLVGKYKGNENMKMATDGGAKSLTATADSLLLCIPPRKHIYNSNVGLMKFKVS